MDDVYIIIFYATLFHVCIYFFDTFFRSCSHYPYLYFLKNTGIAIYPFRIHWFTTAFNRLIQKWGSFRPKIHSAWFTAGTWVSIALMPVAASLVLHSMFQSLKRGLQNGSPDSGVVLLEPMVPGVTMPLSDTGYYVTTLLISSVVHELGHAIASVREDVHISGVGLVLVFILPVAFVDLEQLDQLTPGKQLRIMCAGVWHNIVLSLSAVLLLVALPWIFYPVYDFGSGVQVQSIDKDSPVGGLAGLQEGDQVVQLNECQIINRRTWQSCLLEAVKNTSPGYCISSEFIKVYDESVPAKHLSGDIVDCCPENSPRHICFEYLERESEPLELPQHSCLNARKVVEFLPHHMCTVAGTCPTGLHCFRASLDNRTRLIHIHRTNSQLVLFVGHPAEIFQAAGVSEFVKYYAFLPSALPEAATRLCQFVSMFSSGLAILNIMPCFYFDGQYITRALMDVLLAKKVKHTSVRHAIALCVTIAGSFILLLYLIIMFWSVL